MVREEVHRGADVVKFRQAGLAAEDPKVAMVESPEEIKAVIDTAHQLNRKVAALGGLGEGLGSIAPGKMPDVIAMKVDPLTHIDQLGEPGKVSFVMNEGKVFKDGR